MKYIQPSQYSMEIVGEKPNQKAIREIIMYKEIVDKDDLEYKDDSLTASLILENDNKFDPGNAVRVDIEGKPVGYLAKEDAKLYRTQLVKLGIAEVCTCKAAAHGKRDEPGKVMRFGIWLYIDLTRPLEMGEKKPRKKLFGLF